MYTTFHVNKIALAWVCNPQQIKTLADFNPICAQTCLCVDSDFKCFIYHFLSMHILYLLSGL